MGSITHHDQLNMELAFGFVFLWQAQLEMLKEEDVAKFAKVWVDIYLKFIQKNKNALSDMLIEPSKFNFALEDLSWSDIPSVSFVNIFSKDKDNTLRKYWLGVEEPLQTWLTDSQLSKNFHARALLRKTGIRYKKDDQWVYWSNDPKLTDAKDEKQCANLINDRYRTRAWLYGYRTFYTEKQAIDFINLHTNHYLSYDFPAIRLVSHTLTELPAHVSNPGKSKIQKKEKTHYVISSDYLKDNQQVLVVAPAMQRFLPSKNYTKLGTEKIAAYFDEKFSQPKYAVNELTYQYLALILSEGLFPLLSRHQERLKVEITHLVNHNTDSKLSTVSEFMVQHHDILAKMHNKELSKQVIENLMKIFLKGRMDQERVEKIRDNIGIANEKKQRSPLKELIKNMKTEGHLLFPCTIANGYDWILYELIIKKTDNQYEVNLFRRTVPGLTQGTEDEMQELEKDLMESLQQNTTLKNGQFTCAPSPLPTLTPGRLEEIRRIYPEGPISSGVVIAEYIRCQITGDPMVTDLNKKTLETISKEHRRLMRYYHRTRYQRTANEEDGKVKEIMATDEGIHWREEQNPIGPPVVEEIVGKTKIEKFLNKLF